ncbi:helix-turn-helix domain-containing protein [Nocardia blacklockiae]|uniref:helix-turn-helix domain-containing protein n=1 Tax=Nocardia blacklockiae TaxID=480036 RepID=UPI001895CD7B|nr:helix-turn-helix transcriptional regulator [Nocardia blacklockiae]MBF6175189.1 helix-turn-helix domain-containing protein [Nocardia blacklockiae]
MTELGAFLAGRRARVEPAAVGLPTGRRRRVPGLRREELAQLAGISAEYYQRLEQGRSAHPSDEVLDALAEALRLDPVEREHLRALARPARRRGPVGANGTRPELRAMLDAMDAIPALIITDTFTVLAENALARKLFDALGEHENLARALFLAPAARAFYLEWDDTAAATVAQLRLVAGRYPDDPAATALIEELTAASPEFTALWQEGDVALRTYGRKRFRHPEQGVVTVNYENFELPGDPRQRLVTFTQTEVRP